MSARVDELLSNLKVLALDGEADRHDAESAGTPNGSHDLLIAAHARSQGLTLVTRNLREFQRVPALRVEDWLAPPDPASTCAASASSG